MVGEIFGTSAGRLIQNWATHGLDAQPEMKAHISMRWGSEQREAPIDGFYGCIDVGSWLGKIQFWEQFMFHTPDHGHFEDDMICKHLAGAEAKIAATERATLNYTVRDDHSNA